MKRIAILLAVALALLIGGYWSLRDGARAETNLEEVSQGSPHVDATTSLLVPGGVEPPNDRAAIPGCEPIPGATVRLETGKVVEHVVQLVRTH